MRTTTLLITILLMTGCVFGHGSQVDSSPVQNEQEGYAFIEIEEPGQLAKVARYLAKQFHVFSSSTVKGKILDVVKLTVMSADNQADCMARRLFVIFSSEVSNSAIRKDIKEPTILLAGKHIGTSLLTRSASEKIQVRVVADVRITESLYHMGFMFVTNEGRVLFTVNCKVDRNWAEVKQIEQDCVASAITTVETIPTRLTVSPLGQTEWTGCGQSLVEAKAVYCLMRAIEGQVIGNVRVVRTNSGWCVDRE